MFTTANSLKRALLSTLLLCLLTTPLTALAAQPHSVVEKINFEAASAALSDQAVNDRLGKYGKKLNRADQRAAAVLISMGMLRVEHLDDPQLSQRLAHLQHAFTHPFFKGQTGELALISALDDPWQHRALLAEEELLSVLGDALTQGVLTGYDLRRKDVYAGFPAGHTFTYSHSSALHLQQLTTLMAAHNIHARVFVAPKVSAFLYREDWGTASERVKTLASGARVINGREVAVMFDFESPDSRSAFHQLVLRYAKKDEQDEAGLIADAWWQPFYYTDEPFADFPSISLVIMSSTLFEATLTAVHEKTDAVVSALSGKGFPVRVEKVWVNPAFFRFLNGGYR